MGAKWNSSIFTFEEVYLLNSIFLILNYYFLRITAVISSLRSLASIYQGVVGILFNCPSKFYSCFSLHLFPLVVEYIVMLLFFG